MITLSDDNRSVVFSFLLGGLAAGVLSACSTLSPNHAQLSNTGAQKARNIILFIGDGMGVSTVTAARIYVGQSQGGRGEDHVLPFERFSHIALAKTYNTNQQVPDSAGTATAMLTGMKTRAGVIGVGPQSRRGDCQESKLYTLPTLGELAVSKGKSVGIVTTARLTHATPAAVYGHTPERNWENDAVIPVDQGHAGCIDLAKQLVEFPFDIALGGGRANFFGADLGGKRKFPASNLVADWKEQTGGQYVSDLAELGAIDPHVPTLGLFANSHMSYMLERSEASTEPTLTDITGAAIAQLSQREKGYFLMVESGRIDHGHHAGRAGYALSETAEFARAIEHAIEITDPSETLILVTADHSHVFTMAGYPTRGNPILGHVYGNDGHGEAKSKPTLAADGKAYTTLGYWNGPGAETGPRATPETGVLARQQAIVPTGRSYKKLSETHGGEDVAVYADGPGAENVYGVIEQNKLYDIMLAAFGWEAAASIEE